MEDKKPLEIVYEKEDDVPTDFVIPGSSIFFEGLPYQTTGFGCGFLRSFSYSIRGFSRFAPQPLPPPPPLVKIKDPKEEAEEILKPKPKPQVKVLPKAYKRVEKIPKKQFFSRNSKPRNNPVVYQPRKSLYK